MIHITRFSLLLIALAVCLEPALAGSYSTPVDLWNQAYGDPRPKVSLYRNDANPYIQEVNVTLRAQYQMAAVSANQGEYDGSHHSTSEWRRFRLGGNIRLFEKFRLTNIWNIGGLDTLGFNNAGHWQDHGMSRGNIYDASLAYTLNDHFSVSVGKHYPPMFAENRGSSADYSVPEMPSLEAQFSANSAFGVKFSNNEKKQLVGWQLGVWSNTEERSRGTWGTWQSAYSLVGVSCRVDDVLLKEGRVYLDWVHNTQDMKDMATSRFRDTYTGTTARDIAALYYMGRQGPFSLMLEALWGNTLASYKRGNEVVSPDNAVGIVVMPMYMLNDHIQCVARYQWNKGNDAVKLNTRYASIVRTDGNYVDEQQTIGVGLNFFLYADDHPRCKIMTFVEYSNTSRKHGTGGFTGWTFITGVYTNF